MSYFKVGCAEKGTGGCAEEDQKMLLEEPLK
jgi:hypothetical protein